MIASIHRDSVNNVSEENHMQKEITARGKLLGTDGRLNESGWSRQLLLEYDRTSVGASPLRIKEWDYYEIINPEYGIVLLFFDIGYQGRAVVKWMDFTRGTFEEYGATLWFTRGSMGLPASSDTGDIVFDRDGIHWECLRGDDGGRDFRFSFPGFRDGTGLAGSMRLSQPPGQDTMVNAIPFGRGTRFVYAQKINCMVPDGEVTVGTTACTFSPANHSFGCLDWSRAVFPYHVEWRWCTASGIVGGVPFGLNIDYGFGTESAKSMIFHNNVGHHLDKARYRFDPKDPTKPWTFSDNEDRINLTLTPVCVERGGTNYILLKMKVLKAYGFLTGTVRLDDGTEIPITAEDRLFGSAEAVVNYW
jgi:uncharacterized protein DUF2804